MMLTAKELREITNAAVEAEILKNLYRAVETAAQIVEKCKDAAEQGWSFQIFDKDEFGTEEIAKIVFEILKDHGFQISNKGYNYKTISW